MNPSVLIIEDDDAVRNLIAAAMQAYGYSYDLAGTGGDALLAAISRQPDIYILDLGLPDMHGVEFIRRIRTWTNSPVLVVSALRGVSDKIEALDAGADDYITKPFSVDELMARIRVAMRKMHYDRAGGKDAMIYANGALRIDYVSASVYMDGNQVHLTPIEYKLLTLLAQHTGKVLTHNYILKHIWQHADENDTRSLRVVMATLRKKIEKNPSAPCYLQTHIGIGYRLLQAPAERE